MTLTTRQPTRERLIARMLNMLPRLLFAPFLLIWAVTDPQPYHF